MALEEIKKKFEYIEKGYKGIECENLFIAASYDVEFDEFEQCGMEIYDPSNFLVFIEKGKVDVAYENKNTSFHKGGVYLIRKYTHAFYSKTFTKEEKQAKSYIFSLPDIFLRKVIANYKFDKNLEPIGERIFEINPNQSLKTIIHTIKYAVDNEKAICTKALETNIEEALQAIVESNPKLAILFKEFSLANRADLNLFMNLNFMRKVPLSQLAILSGRSLSTFNRDFKSVFNNTPHKWILKKRLELAYNLLIESHSDNVSDIYIKAGFEDLAHFSKAFKKEYGYNPSTLKLAAI